LGIINVDFEATAQLLVIYSAFVKYLRKKWEYSGAVHQLFIDFKKAYDSVRREALCNILIQFGITMKLTSGSRVRGFDPDRSRWIFSDVKKSSACLPSEGK
jgi:hypothetical protein